MLLSAVKHASDGVIVDLLTYQDLEVLKSRKAAPQQQQHDPHAPHKHFRFDKGAVTPGAQGFQGKDVTFSGADAFFDNYDERGTSTLDLDVSIENVDLVALEERRIYRQIMIPEYADGSRPGRAARTQNEFSATLPPEHLGHPGRFVGWGIRTIRERLEHPAEI
jgi:hypothetical protein